MDEARRFLRYVTPGLTFAVQALLLLFIVNPPWTLDRIGELKEDTGAGLAFALFLASGGLGYLFSVVHHRLHWSLPWLPIQVVAIHLAVIQVAVLSTIDHTRVVNKLRDADLLDLRKLDEETAIKIDPKDN